MELAADELVAALSSQSPVRFNVEKIRPAMRRRFGRLTGRRGNRSSINMDRFVGRFVDYPAVARRITDHYDVFHITDHSYAHLVHALPAARTGVFCHDLDTFRCLLEPTRDPRPRWFRAMTARILRGLESALVVFHTTEAVRAELLSYGIVPADRLVRAPYGVSKEFAPGPAREPNRPPYLLHVGSSIPRKRVDVLLQTFARVRRHRPDLRLLHAGADFTPEQYRHIDEFALRKHVTSLVAESRPEIAELYRGAALVLLPSESEGFGLPLIEALACGANVVASDIPVLREVGGEAVTYCRVADIDGWTGTVLELLEHPERRPPKDILAKQASRFRWATQADTIADAYLSRLGPNTGHLRSKGVRAQ